jgi:hypothetical protein
MATSGTISTTTFNTRRLIDQAFRRCRLPAEAITSEMQDYAKDALYLLLSELANNRVPSWCIEEVVLPMYENNPDVTLPIGTVEVLNANYRVLSQLEPDADNITVTATEYKVDFATSLTTTATVNTVGIKWNAAAVPLTFQVSNDDLSWTTVGTITPAAVAGEWTWYDIEAAKAYQYFRITSTSTIYYTRVYLGTSPQEIPLGVLNRDTYVVQSNKVFPGRPNSYWFQRDRAQPVMHLWPAPNAAAEEAQLVIWRHRHIMDVGTLQQEIEVPQRWLEAIAAGLAARVAGQTPQVDINLVGVLDQKAQAALYAAWNGDNDGSPTFYQPTIGVYTK